MVLTASSSFSRKLRKLEPEFHEKIWGARELAPWFPNTAGTVGEVWWSPVHSILVKFLFTSEKLSVQVHPGGSGGKTEMWHILRARPDSTIALGFKEPMTRERLREAALSGKVDDLLNWVPVKAGDTFLTRAGTVHAIGPGISLCEIQQANDVTYRIYDYGRGRELHLDQALAVSAFSPHPGHATLPVSCEYFHTELIELTPGASHSHGEADGPLLIVLEGSGEVSGQPYTAGEVWVADEHAVVEAAAHTRILRTGPPPV